MTLDFAIVLFCKMANQFPTKKLNQIVCGNKNDIPMGFGNSSINKMDKSIPFFLIEFSIVESLIVEMVKMVGIIRME